MGKKINLSETEERLAINYYTSGEISNLGILATKFGIGKIKMRTILSKYGIIRNERGGQIKHNKTNLIINNKIKELKISNDSKKLIAKCKKTGLEIDDAMNYSGALTRHILSTYGDVPIPRNTYQRKKYELQNGMKWYEEYFDIIEIDKVMTRICPICSWETSDILNKTGCFEVHLTEEHSLSLVDYLIDYPSDIVYHPKHNEFIKRTDDLNDINKSVICHICNEKMFVLSNTHLKKHNITAYDYKLLYSGKIMNDTLSLKTGERLMMHNINGDTITKGSSKPELEIGELLDSLKISYIKNNRTILNGKEIDFIIEDMKVGIEFNGNIHHTEFFGGKDKSYHLNKTRGANANGYKLIHIFSDEWENNKDIVLNKLTHILSKNDGFRIGARKCILKEIPTFLKNDFLNTYHIQGEDNSNVKLGAFYNDILVGVMTFKKCNDGIELSRFATNYYYNISGLGSKLLKFYIKNYSPTKIISFADRRWTLDSSDNLYIKLGFKLTNILSPDYKYYNRKINNHKRFHKFGFRKKILIKKYNLNPNLTELEMIKELGYDRIWDCGLFKYELDCTNLYK